MPTTPELVTVTMRGLCPGTKPVSPVIETSLLERFVSVGVAATSTACVPGARSIDPLSATAVPFTVKVERLVSGPSAKAIDV